MRRWSGNLAPTVPTSLRLYGHRISRRPAALRRVAQWSRFNRGEDPWHPAGSHNPAAARTGWIGVAQTSITALSNDRRLLRSYRMTGQYASAQAWSCWDRRSAVPAPARMASRLPATRLQRRRRSRATTERSVGCRGGRAIMPGSYKRPARKTPKRSCDRQRLIALPRV